MDNKSISFRIGVTGHRDLLPRDREAAIEQSTEFLSWLQNTMPATKITVISGLAEGADRVFAEAALALDMSVEAVLPMPLIHYKNDFAPSSCGQLDRLLDSKNVTCTELPLDSGLGSDESDWPEDARNCLYANLSKDLLHRSSMLVALWDGEPIALVGGTTDTVATYLGIPSTDRTIPADIIKADKALLDGDPIVYWIPVRRSSSDNSSAETGSTREPCWLSAADENIQWWPSAPTDFCQELTRFDRFNQHHAELSQSESLVSYGNLLDGCCDTLDRDAQQFEASDHAYVMADSLALYHQSRSDRLFKLFSLMAASMGLLFLVYAKLAAVQLLLIGYLAIFFIGVFLHARGGKQAWFTRHLVYRCLAEILRVRFYLDLAGARSRVDIRELLQTSGISNFEGFSWIRYVLRSTQPRINTSNLAEDTMDQRIESVRVNWIEDQAGYFQRKTHFLHQRHHKLERIKRWIIGGLVMATIILVFFKKTLVGIDLGNHLSLKTLLIFLMGLLPFWLGVWEMYQNKMAVKELMWQYQNQWKRFSLAAETLQKSGNVGFRRDTVALLGKTSILENCLWIVQRYHRDHEPPVAG